MAALAALCLLGPILGYAHMLSVGHARCPEHGELLHVDVGMELAQAEGDGPARPADVALESSFASESHEHHHCAVMSARKAQASVRSADLAIPVATPRCLPLAQLTATAHPPVALYVLAPKNSPPA